MICGKTYLYLRKQVESSYVFAFVPALCKSWSCPKCRLIKSHIVSNYIRDNFTGDNLYFISLTFFHSGSVSDAWKLVGERWNRLRSYVQKMHGKFTYLRVVEPHKNGGWPHLHILVDGCVFQSYILSMLTQWGFGWNAHSVRVSSKHASEYMSKYLSKPWPSEYADTLRAVAKTRIVCVSRDLPAIFTSKSEWEVVRHDLSADDSIPLVNTLLNILHNHDATVIQVMPLGEGFIIESDIPIYDSWLNEADKYAWFRVGESRHYEYLPYGLQQVLSL
jgi:hypothetical protein